MSSKTTHDLLPNPADGQSYYYVKAKDAQAKPLYGGAYVLADTEDGAEEIVKNSTNELGLLGIKWAKCKSEVDAEDLESRVRSTGGFNEVLYRDADGEIQRVHRGML